MFFSSALYLPVGPGSFFLFLGLGGFFTCFGSLVCFMRGPEFKVFLSNMSSVLPVSLVAKPGHSHPKDRCMNVPDSLPVWDALTLFSDSDCLVLPDAIIVKRHMVLKRPLRIIFFVLLTELESRLYRVQEWSHNPVRELNEKHLNDYIRVLVDDPVLFSLQSLYSSRSDFKEDLKAASSLRNLIVHVNKKLELDLDFETAINRRDQILKLLDALDMILDEQRKALEHA